MTPNPLISAILCTYNRAPLLRQALDALRGQTLGTERLEVILIDDGSTDDTAQVAADFAPLLNLHYAWQPNSGLAAGKNHGICLARSPIVVFLDDDDLLDSRALEQHYLSHQRHPDPRIAVLGFTGLAPEPARSPLMHYVTQIGCQLFAYPHLKHGQTLDFSYFWGGRSSCKRALLLEHGFFNPAFRFGAEDIELAFRLREAGLRVRYNAQAIGYMIRTLSVDDFARRSELQGRSNWVFQCLHPNDLVRAWTGIDSRASLEAEWARIEEHYPRLLASARGLDRFAAARAKRNLPLDPPATRLLHRAYAAAFRASRVKGSVERMREDA